MAGFQGVSEKFHVRLVSESGGTEPVLCQVGLDGLFLLSPDGQRTRRKFPLNHISRWALRGSSLVLYTRTPVDVEERTVTLQADDRIIRSMLDTLTCCCMQMVELLQTSSHSTENDRQVAESLSAMINGKKKNLTSDEVEWWRSPEKTGWMYSQGDVIKTWRRRWFILKQGFLFRFATKDVSSDAKPRGIVDLSAVQDVLDGRDATGKPNSLKLSTAAGGQVCYLCDSETEQVEWLSALEGSVMRIVRAAAGVDEDAALAATAAQAQKPVRDEKQHNSEWARKLEAGFTAAGQRPGFAGGGSSNPVVKVVGFEDSRGDYAPAQPSQQHNDYGGAGAYSSVAGYGNVAGARMAADREPVVSVNYGGYGGNAGQQHSNDSDSSAFVQVDQYAYSSPQPGQQRQQNAAGAPAYPQQQQQQQPPNYYAQQQPSSEQVGGSYGQQPNFMDYAPQQSYAASSYQTLPYTSAAPQGQPPQPAAPASSPWQMHQAPDGRPYWHNASMGVTTWDAPA